MPIEINLPGQRIDDVKVDLGKLKRESTPAVVRALNKTLTGARTDVTKAVTTDLNLKAKDVRSKVVLKKANYPDITAHVKRTGKPVPLSKFIGTRSLVRGGVSVKVKRHGKRTSLKRAFEAEMPTGHLGIFQRKYSFDKYARPIRPGFPYGALPKRYRLKIKELTGPRVEDIISKPEVMRGILDSGGTRFNKNMEHELNRMLSK